MKDLEFYPTGDLFTELGKRFKNVVVVGDGQTTKDEKYLDSKYFAGNEIQCLGLLELAREFILKSFRKDTEVIDSKET